MPAHDYASTRFSELAEINASNIGKLTVPFTFSIGVARGQEGAPLVVNNTMYIVAPYPNEKNGRRHRGRDTNIQLQPTRIGVFRGQCAEFCGAQHANMALYVVVQSQQDFDDWRAAQMKPANDPADSISTRGRDTFMSSACALWRAPFANWGPSSWARRRTPPAR